MKLTVLSFWQPYAWFIVNGYADVDSRLWAPPAARLGTWIGIHASRKKITRSDYSYFKEIADQLKIKNFPQSPNDFDYGCLVGTVIIKSVVKNSKSFWAEPGYFHWQLSGAKKLTPKPMKGKMGWFSVEI